MFRISYNIYGSIPVLPFKLPHHDMSIFFRKYVSLLNQKPTNNTMYLILSYQIITRNADNISIVYIMIMLE